MSDTDILIQAFRDALALPEDTDIPALAYGDHPNWDSVGHMALIAEIEERFDVMFDTDDVLALSSFDQALTMVRRQAVPPVA
jgi:acyl carrier protein